MCCVDGCLRLSLLLCIIVASSQGSSGDIKFVEKLSDHKEFKKLLRVRTNVLVLFTDSSTGAAAVKHASTVASEAGRLIQGRATLAHVDCQASDGKKLCKKLKIAPQPVVLKHYQGGEFHKDYDRKMTAKSMFRFLIDPTGDAPWDEDPTSSSVLHIDDPTSLRKTIAQGKPTLVMFYAPWCGHCKRLKPDFSSAATELAGRAVLAGMDLTQPGNEEVARKYQVEGYPTLEYFEGGKHKFRYSGQNSKDGIISWMQEPTEKPVMGEPQEEEVPWSEVPSEVVHLTDETFDSFISSKKSVLVMFYAPWCGHCKMAKPEYVKAAQRLKDDNIDGVLAAVDATVHKKVSEKNEIEGFPTFNYFKDGKFAWKVNERTEEGFYKFMKNPTEPPPPELPWSEQPGSVLHLTAANFKSEIKKKKSALVMFYAPWCGYCKKAKPFFSEAAEKMSEDTRLAFAAVDCTENGPICQEYGVQSYPTIVHLSYGKNRVDYQGPHETQSFMDAVRPVVAESATTPPPPPPPTPALDFGSKVKMATSENFKETVATGKTLVMFFAPWCGHCKAAKPQFSEAAEEAKSGSFVAVDCTIHKAVCTEHGVRGYPTFKVFVDGKANEYTRSRTKSDFLSVFSEVKEPKSEL